MSFFERLREIGTIRALGTRRLQVFQMFVQEGLALGVLGGLLGVLLGWGLGSLVNAAGLEYVPPGLSVAVPFKIWLASDNAAIPFMTVVLATLISALYPAFKATRLQIVEALRYV